MTRRIGRKGVHWETPLDPNFRWEHVAIEVMMDIREELQQLNALLRCPHFLDIPHKLERIKRNTTRKRKPTAVGKPKLRVVRS